MEVLVKEPQQTQRELLDKEVLLRRYNRYRVIRRVRDILFSGVALLLTWPIILIFAVAIFVESPQAGPIFVQKRVGRDGKVFRFYKLRSMIPHAEDKLEELLDQNEMDGPAFKIEDDPRITKVGRFIRKTSIDELPQFWNILKGDMSIVGPRPPLPREVKEYDAYQKQRLYVAPGLTCYWQIQPQRNDLTFDEWMELDIQYMQECSFWTDWKIIFKTVGAVLGMHGR